MKTDNGPALTGALLSDKAPALCRGDDKVRSSDALPTGAIDQATLPRHARLPINRCNLPAVVLGSLTFQRHPAPLLLDGVAELHRDLFRRLDQAGPENRGEIFRDYLTVHFQLEWPEEMGCTGRQNSRAKANYVRMIRGWSFDADSREGAVLKGWVESRFGLLPRWHGQPLRDTAGEAWLRYMEMRSQGLYGTSALESQLDLVYTYCQYELARRHPGARHVTLYRGVNRVADHEILDSRDGGRHTILLNNLNSFTCSRDRACEFGDYILAVEVPLSKIFFHCGLLPAVLRGEDEFLAIGGVVDVTLSTI
jgi:NAD+--dinitrogen-reductase ADP-D-ribosyltransferase